MKQRLGAAPNFVHSMDACHLMMTLIKARELGISSFACIHDDFGTHAEDTDKLHNAIRWAFFSLYSDNDVLADFKVAMERLASEKPVSVEKKGRQKLPTEITLTEPPKKGKLNLAEITRSPYFFG